MDKAHAYGRRAARRRATHHNNNNNTQPARVAQSAERKTLNLVVVGSIPTEGVFLVIYEKLSPPTVASSSA